MGINKLYVVTAAKSNPGPNVLEKGRAGWSLSSGGRGDQGRREGDLEEQRVQWRVLSAKSPVASFLLSSDLQEGCFILSEKVKMPVMGGRFMTEMGTPAWGRGPQGQVEPVSCSLCRVAYSLCPPPSQPPHQL